MSPATIPERRTSDSRLRLVEEKQTEQTLELALINQKLDTVIGMLKIGILTVMGTGGTVLGALIASGKI